jgi:hypothetical protein
MAVRISINVEPRGFGPLISVVYRWRDNHASLDAVLAGFPEAEPRGVDL